MDHDFLFCNSLDYFPSHMADLVALQMKQDLLPKKNSLFQLTKYIIEEILLRSQGLISPGGKLLDLMDQRPNG